VSDLRAALEERLPALFGGPVRVEKLALLGGGASMEAWALEVEAPSGPLSLVLRRASGGRIYPEALSLEEEHALLQAAQQSGVRVPKPYGYLPDLLGHDAFVMERLSGETVGRKIVQRPELAAARDAMPAQMAEQLARIHRIDALPFLPRFSVRGALDRLRAQLDLVGEPHPAIELGLAHLRDVLPDRAASVVCHGDFRVGNFVVDERGIAGVLDWEFAHLGDPLEDVAWPLVRAWRFGMDQLRLGGIAQPDEFLARYSELTGRELPAKEVRAFELLGNVRWATGCLTQARRHLTGQDRSVELAILGRLGAEVEHEILAFLEGP
jgi:aminoglycoside phosphotransferase (APT) family kinase protein